jgi:predicted lysophospholipase L1 biosynthesis ABC-type transport system permease subunit
VIAARLAREYPKTNKGWGTALDPLHSALVGHTRRMLMLLLGAVALMLLIASVNVANLMLVRTKAREVELAMRSALGASPGRVIRQLLAESAVLAACGGALGLALAAWGVDVLVELAPEGLPRLDEIAVNARIATFAVGVTALVTLAFGLWPAWRASRAPLNSAIQASVRSTAAAGHRRSQMLLVSSELAIAQVLLVGAGLLLASFARLTSLRSGLRSARSRRHRRQSAGREVPRRRHTNPVSPGRPRTADFDARRSACRDGDAGADAARACHTRRVD